MDQGERALSARIAEAGSIQAARSDCEHVLAVRLAEARGARSTKWLSGSMFEEGSWRVARSTSLEEAKRARPGRGYGAEPPAPIRVKSRGDDDMPPLMPSGREVKL